MYPLEDRIADKKAGVGVQQRPYVGMSQCILA